jgi:Ca2+/Na+ antiporter
MPIIKLVGYLYLSFKWSKENNETNADHGMAGTEKVLKVICFFALSLGGIIIASRLLISCAAEGAIRAGCPKMLWQPLWSLLEPRCRNW